MSDQTDRRITKDEMSRVLFLAEMTEGMRPNDRAFIEGMAEKLDEWGERAFFSVRQVGYLESIEAKYL